METLTALRTAKQLANKELDERHPAYPALVMEALATLAAEYVTELNVKATEIECVTLAGQHFTYATLGDAFLAADDNVSIRKLVWSEGDETIVMTRASSEDGWVLGGSPILPDTESDFFSEQARLI